MPAYTVEKGLGVLMGLPPPGKSIHQQLLLPCGKCLGCLLNKTKEWALRCRLELQEHKTAAFTTLTYDNQHLPPTLTKRDLQLFLKRLRRLHEKQAKRGGKKNPPCASPPEGVRSRPSNDPTPGTLRFFASGEYGEQTKRPHYHAILYGLRPGEDDSIIQKAWGLGHTYTLPVTPAAIAYVVGYTSKKMGDRDRQKRQTLVDPDTGELLSEWQPPFILMSRKPGIGGDARKHTASWKNYAVDNGYKMAVPRFYHDAWKATATPEQIEKVQVEKRIRAQQHATTLDQLHAQGKIQEQQQAMRNAKRKKA